MLDPLTRKLRLNKPHQVHPQASRHHKHFGQPSNRMEKIAYRRLAGLLVALSCLVSLAGCQTAPAAATTATSTAVTSTTATSTAATSSSTSPASASASLSLKIGIMPAVDAAPILLADEKGYFQALGLTVDVQLYTNAMNRQSALQSGSIDGAMTDVIALVNNVENGFDIKVTTSTDGVFPFLMKGDLTGRTEITAAMMEASVTNFLSDRLLGGQYKLKKIYINEIPARLEMIGKGAVDLAVVPEPMASQGELGGLVKRLYPSPDVDSPDVMVFTGQAIRSKAEALKRFHQAYNQAVDAIAQDDNAARDILISALKLNPEIRSRIILPAYRRTRVPSEAYLREVALWNERVLGRQVNKSYALLVDPSFVQP